MHLSFCRFLIEIDKFYQNEHFLSKKILSSNLILDKSRRNSMKFQIYFLIASAVAVQLEASNILAVWPVPSRSNFNVGLALFEQLAESGHKVSEIMQSVDKCLLIKIKPHAFRLIDNAYQSLCAARLPRKHQVRQTRKSG